MALLLDSLREAGAEQQAAALAGPCPAAHAPLDDPDGVAELLDSLREAGAGHQAAALAARDPAAHAALDDPGAVAALLDSLREAGAEEQAAALAGRPPPTPPSTTRAPWPGCWTACGRRARRSRPPRWPTGCRGQACSSSSTSKKTARIGSGSAGRLMAAPPSHGDGKIWADAAGLSNT